MYIHPPTYILYYLTPAPHPFPPPKNKTQQGQIEVKYALPDRTLTLTRPPKNRLPLANFSYRPLFTALGLESVMTVFGLLLTESRVALVSERMALLTPVAEALLSLLFPFVWQVGVWGVWEGRGGG